MRGIPPKLPFGSAGLKPLPILPPLLATGMSRSDDRARSGSDYSPCRMPGFTVVVSFLAVLFFLRLPL